MTRREEKWQYMETIKEWGEYIYSHPHKVISVETGHTTDYSHSCRIEFIMSRSDTPTNKPTNQTLLLLEDL